MKNELNLKNSTSENTQNEKRSYQDYFRDDYLINEGKSKFLGNKNGYIYLTIILTVATITPLVFLSQIESFNSNYLWLAVLYFLTCNLFEYILHRFPMHSKMKGLEFLYEHVTVHHSFYNQKYNYFKNHKDFMAVMLPLLYFFFISAFFLLLATGVYLVSNLDNALFFEFVIYSYYLMYELLHFAYHSPEDSLIKKIPLIKKLSRFHLTHHRTDLMDQYNFNISIPIFDFIFRTGYVEKKVESEIKNQEEGLLL